MTKAALRWIVAGLLILISGLLFAQDEIKIGILAYRPKQMVQAQWAPLATALNKALPEYRFALDVYDSDELSAAVESRQVDFILTNPSSYLLMAKRSGLSSPLATLSNLAQGQPVNAFGGVIFIRAGRTDIKRLEDVRGKSVAFVSTSSFGGYQMQACELSHAGINIPKDVKVVVTGQPHDKVVDAVLAQRADVGFVRSGVLEEFAREGKLDLTKVTVINQQNLPGFQDKISTRLYPEWPLSSLPQTNINLKRKVSAFLLTLHENSALANQLQIHGFDVPSNYAPVEEMLRELHMPPFDVTPTFTASDVWDRYRWFIVALLTSVTLILLLGLNTLLVNRRLKDRSRDLNVANMKLQEEIVERKQVEEEISILAFYDTLTKLPNRRLLMDRLHLAMLGSARSQHYGAVLFLDLDRFKTINDTLGHDCGDLLLIEVAQRIQSCVREFDTVARLGGDEFVILLDGIDAHAEAASQTVALIAEKIRFALIAPYQIKGNELHSSTSIGICLYLGYKESADALLKHADMAMYQAKDSGRNTVRFFDPAMQFAVETRAALEADLRRAVPDQQLHLYYQIQMDSDLRPTGAEALIRWIHPARGMVSPMQFIPIAEESSLILDIGGWVLDTACRQLSVWAKHEHTQNLSIAVNVSAQQFKQPDFVESVAMLLRTYALDASHLKLELTESVVLNDVKDVVTKMHALKALGVGLSMDDFGTGYSSLSYLKQLPLDQLKIDQSFVRDIATDLNDAVMVKTIINMAKNFRLNVIAEGVETDIQLAFLRAHGCMAYQGYYFSKPVPIEQLDALLKQN